MAAPLTMDRNRFFHYQSLDASIWNDLTIREAAQIAEACYEVSDTSKIPERWQSAKIEGRFLAKENEGQDMSPAFFSRVFVCPLSNAAIIGFAGLQKTADLFLCAKFVLIDKLPAWGKIDYFIQKVVLPNLEKQGFDLKRVRVLGHSLGGSIAHLVGDRYGWHSLSIDGLGVKSLIPDLKNAALAKTVAIVPNAINQLGDVFGEIYYVFPGDSHFNYGIEIDEYFERLLFVESICVKDNSWLDSEDPFDLALCLVHKTVAFHAISNFTEGKPDEASANYYVQALKQGVETTLWNEAKQKFKEGMVKGVTDFSNGCEHLGLSTLKGGKGGYYAGKDIGLTTGAAIGGVLGAAQLGTTGAVIGAGVGAVDGGWRWGKIGLGIGLGVVACVCVFTPGLQAALPALPAIANAIVVVVPSASAYAGTIATVAGTTVAGGAAVGGVGAVKNGVSLGVSLGLDGAVIGWEGGKWWGEKICTVTGTVVGGAIGLGTALPKTLESFARGGTEIASGSKGVAFFTVFFYMRPKISHAVVHHV